MHETTRRSGVWTFTTYAFILLMAVVTIVPLYWVLIASTLPEEAFLSSGSLPLLPGGAFLENFRALQAHQDINFVRSIGNSVFIASVYTLLSVLLCSMAGFAFAKYEFRFKEPIFYTILATLVLPIQLLVIPLFLLMSQIGLMNSYWAIILPWAANPVGIFLMRQNMKSVPDALLESARMDGASEFQVFYKVVLPTLKSSLAALATILFLFQWNLFLFPLVVLESDKYTIPVAINQLVGAQRVYYDQIMVAAGLSIIPIFLLFLFLQQYFVKGIIGGSIKE
ncbi:carbohydrate ABC transporter permease [Haloferax sp. Atlit-12N]|uniref:carbohydrate ABC transporter permease n=1 Tax=Haloferax TaxID=2251 RepID=UPI000E2678DB|nr:carbohydrate ABC transporter permease [Haloferax sp. Atlit-12N]RDZ59764.1 carbohydrate ABC transporter permease [Haloferax sp. Atlit-12N]